MMTATAFHFKLADYMLMISPLQSLRAEFIEACCMLIHFSHKFYH